ncbi:MAG: adenylosuccinate lyase [Planctomycetota bacterium]|nr:adenylosuccinate lyase [Planctomycetota bacterium]
MNDHIEYESPLTKRYAGPEMRELFGAQRKFSTWRRLWLALAQAQRKLGLNISDEQIKEMAEHLDDIDFAAAAKYEKEFRHDVMAHIHAFGDAAPAARGIIHLGATSQFVVDNTDLILMRMAMDIISGSLAGVIDAFGSLAQRYRSLPCLAFTHFQPAQLTTFGKRAAVWCYDFALDLNELQHRIDSLEFRSVKGTTGTQDSFLALFDGDHEKVRSLEKIVAEKMGFERICPVTGQTYSRKVDAQIAAALAGIGASAHKFCNDVRLMSGMKEVDEPFGAAQVGSSAMPYKRNPMRCERATALARFLMDVSASPMHTAAEQWLERSLDDSANKRLAIPEAFLAADGILRIVLNVARGLVVYEGSVAAHVAAELPFMASERILMEAVKAGGDRQKLHEKIRQHSILACEQVKVHGRANDLISRLKDDGDFACVDIDSLLEPSAFIGRSPQQVDEFITAHVEPVRRHYAHKLGAKAELEV